MAGRGSSRALFSALLSLVVGAVIAAQPSAPSAGAALLSSRDVVLRAGEDGADSFRYLPDGEWIAFDRNVVLSAAPGESRAYAIEGRSGAAILWSRAYSIDKRPPSRPRASPDSGAYGSSISIRLECPDAERIFWSLSGADAADGSFAVYDSLSPPRLEAGSIGSSTMTLVAFAADAAGNRGPPARYVYRFAPQGLPIAAPQLPGAPVLKADPSITEPSVKSADGEIALELPIPAGKQGLFSVSSPSPPASIDEFTFVPPEADVARIVLRAPYGWRGEIPVYYGIGDGAGASYNPKPFVARVANDPEPISQPAVPPQPELLVDASGRGAFLFFPAYDGDVFVSLDDAPAAPYLSPLRIGQGGRNARVEWYGLGESGRRSAMASRTFAVPSPSPEAEVAGAREGERYGGAVALVARGARELRYEMRLDGTVPPEPGATSPLFPAELSVDCPNGAEAAVVLRYRAFDGGYPGESKSLRFVVDRKPPSAPRAAEIPPPYTDEPKAIALLRDPGSIVYASVEVDGEGSGFAVADGPLPLPGRDAGPVSYIVRAYAVDAAGNRSAEMPPIAVVVDRSSVYASSDARAGGDGSPSRPLRDLGAALALAAKEGKRSVHLRGSFLLTKRFETAEPIEIDGGFGPDWSRKRTERAVVEVAAGAPGPALGAVGASLTLRGIDIVSRAPCSPLFAVSAGSLLIEDCSVAVSAEGDALLVRAADSSVSVERSTMRADRALSFSGVQASRSEVRLSASSLSASAGVRFFGGFDLDGGSLALDGALVESSADLGASLISLRSSRISVDRSLFRAQGGSGFLRLGSFAESGGEIGNSKFVASWGGRATLFDVSGRGPAFRHDTIVAEGKKGELTFFDCAAAQPETWNCVLACLSGSAVLSRCGVAPAAGAFVADCVYGFDLLSEGPGQARIATLAALNALNLGSAFASGFCITENPARTFAATAKSAATLARDSACVDAAFSLGGAYARDFRGAPRPAAWGRNAPDIGADEYSE